MIEIYIFIWCHSYKIFQDFPWIYMIFNAEFIVSRHNFYQFYLSESTSWSIFLPYFYLTCCLETLDICNSYSQLFNYNLKIDILLKSRERKREILSNVASNINLSLKRNDLTCHTRINRCNNFIIYHIYLHYNLEPKPI